MERSAGDTVGDDITDGAIERHGDGRRATGAGPDKEFVVTPGVEVNTGLENARQFAPLVCRMAVTFGLPVNEPFGERGMKLVMVIVPPAGMVKGSANDGVWAKLVVFVDGPPPPPAAALSATAHMAQGELFVDQVVDKAVMVPATALEIVQEVVPSSPPMALFVHNFIWPGPLFSRSGPARVGVLYGGGNGYGILAGGRGERDRRCGAGRGIGNHIAGRRAGIDAGESGDARVQSAAGSQGDIYGTAAGAGIGRAPRFPYARPELLVPDNTEVRRVSACAVWAVVLV